MNLIKDFRTRQFNRGICNSSVNDYLSTDTFDASTNTDGSSDGGSGSIFGGVLSAVTALGQTEIRAANQPSLYQQPMSRPLTATPNFGLSTSNSSLGTIVLLVLVVLVGFFAFKKLA